MRTVSCIQTESVYQKLIKVMKTNEVSHHESDLYVKVTDVSSNIINEYKFKRNVSTFISQLTGSPWYEIPFAYDPFYERLTKI